MEDLRQLAVRKLAEIEAADTLENERRLTEMLAGRGMQMSRGRRKGAARYTVKLADGSQIVGVTLAEVEVLLSRKGKTAP
ncbi:hypothetical protein ASC89_22085 [Devosia sp. Root413D1]|uniref:hypothetical protein n=1 Tax=Devosia sp. Root413D1 TaxID=1736531 RepID=UPI0006F604C1|nr:hypothetical protein [Devosia sp. Root413D1]KQW75629.1 hypothetical protein ASC89_22085 [Devosia sp. Root413D1]